MKFSYRRLDDRPGSGPTLDMTPEGGFREPPAAPASVRLLRYAVILAVLFGSLALASLVLWFALLLVPVAIGAALVAYGAYKWRIWRLRNSLRGQRDVAPY